MKPHVPKPLILCEGKEDQLVIEALAKHLGLETEFVIESYDGKDCLKAHLLTLKARPEFSRGEFSKVIVTRDADSDFASAWDAVKAAISSVFACQPNATGEWMALGNGMTITAWVIPGPGQSGMIETLCMESARTKSPKVFSCLDSFVGCLEGVHGGKLHEKTRFAIWTIAAQGLGAQKRLSLERAIPNLPINWEDEAFSSLKKLMVAAVDVEI